MISSKHICSCTCFTKVATLLLCLLAALVSGVRIGDRHHGSERQGYFYAFGSDISIIEPSTGEIVKTLEGSSQWGDAVYIRDLAQIRKYIFANDRATNSLWVIDTINQEIIAKIDVGQRPVHLYAIESREEVWTHPDGDGDFDIVHLGDAQYLSHDSLVAHLHTPGHGKLLFDPNLGDKGYVTNTAESYIYQLDLEKKEMVDSLNLNTSIDGTYSCARTHGIAFSPVNNHLYIECSDPSACSEDFYTNATICSGSVWEIDTETFSPVRRFVSDALDTQYSNNFGMKGQTYTSPDEGYIIVPNKKNNYVHFLKAIEDADTETFEVPVKYNPGKVAFYPKDGSSWGANTEFSDYILFIALEDDDSSSGVAYIDCEDVYNAWYGQLDDVPVNYISVGAGNKYRPIMRGGDYVLTPSDYTSNGYQTLSIMQASSTTEKHVVSDLEISRIVWAPYHTDDLMYEIDEIGLAMDDSISQMSNEIDELHLALDDNIVEINNILIPLAIAAIVFGLLAFVMGLVTCCLIRKNLKTNKLILERGLEMGNRFEEKKAANV